MSSVTVHDGVLRIELTVPERVLSLHGANIEIPLTEIRGARIVRDIFGQLRGMRMPGAGLPGLLAIGTWRGMSDGRTFHDFALIHHSGPGVIVTTSGHYERLLLGTGEPEKLVAQLGNAG
ncbi:MAG TPA: hypothetical protein VIG48_01860 [Jatrophihabitans sp.]|jgi:hypothetical protein